MDDLFDNDRLMLPMPREEDLLLPVQQFGRTLQVRFISELNTYGLFFGKTLLAMHPRPRVCYLLIEHLLDVWAGMRPPDWAIDAFGWLMEEGGLGVSEAVMWLVADGTAYSAPA